MNEEIILLGEPQARHAVKKVWEGLEQDKQHCVLIRPYKKSKTLAQLRALFGLWYTYLSEQLGYSKDELHQWHKIGISLEWAQMGGGWLIDIYLEDPQNSIQEMWVDLYHEYNEFYADQDLSQETADFKKHLKRISLSWATCEQMTEYMKRIEHYYINNDMPLPIPDKFRKYYRR